MDADHANACDTSGDALNTAMLEGELPLSAVEDVASDINTGLADLNEFVDFLIQVFEGGHVVPNDEL